MNHEVVGYRSGFVLEDDQIKRIEKYDFPLFLDSIKVIISCFFIFPIKTLLCYYSPFGTSNIRFTLIKPDGKFTHVPFKCEMKRILYVSYTPDYHLMIETTDHIYFFNPDTERFHDRNLSIDPYEMTLLGIKDSFFSARDTKIIWYRNFLSRLTTKSYLIKGEVISLYLLFKRRYLIVETGAEILALNLKNGKNIVLAVKNSTSRSIMGCREGDDYLDIIHTDTHCPIQKVRMLGEYEVFISAFNAPRDDIIKVVEKTKTEFDSYFYHPAETKIIVKIHYRFLVRYRLILSAIKNFDLTSHILTFLYPDIPKRFIYAVREFLSKRTIFDRDEYDALFLSNI